MNEVFDSIELKVVEQVVNILNRCTDVYIYIYDLTGDKLLISEDILNTFDFPGASFSNASQYIQKIIFPSDLHAYTYGIEELKTGRREEFNSEYRLLDKNSMPVWVSARGKMVNISDSDNKVIIGCISLIESRDRMDSLTKLPTEGVMRRDFTNLQEKKRSVSGFIMKVNVDNLGVINEHYGKKTGDLVIKLIGEGFEKACGTDGKVYKLAGDEFACMNLSGSTAPEAQRIYQSLKRELSEAEMRINYDVVFTVSVGAVAFFNDRSSLEDLMQKLQFALQTAKRKGKNTLAMFSAGDYSRHVRSLGIQEKLRDSIKNEFRGFELFYQPVVNARQLYLDSDSTVTNVIGAEALIRWTDPLLGTLSPEEFIPLLEKTGLIIPVGRWILITAFNKCREWNKIQKNFHMSVNLSYIQVKKSDILTDVQIALGASGVNPANITLELTESGYMDSENELQALVNEFNKMGLKVDIDDFGTGYSNLRYLQYLNAYTLKLDYSFVHKATGGDEGDEKVIRHITQMAHELGMLVCMEGVETEEDIGKLKIYEPDKYQGFYFGRPCNAVHFREHYLRPDIKKDIYKPKA